MARRPRHLSPEERALWDRVARSADPLHPERKDRPPEPPAAARAAPKPAAAPPPPPPIPRFRVGEAASHRGSHDLLPGLSESLRSAPVRMDARAHQRLTRGKLKPEGRIDLHGMTLAEAHPALTDFILMSHAAGRRLVLVITGKGRLRDDEAPMPVRQGALRHQVPRWLSLPPLGGLVLQVAPAHIRHGGEGAYYVYLRRSR